MAASYTCDGCGFPVVDPEHVGHVLKRDYCPTCAEKARAFIAEEEALRIANHARFTAERAALIGRTKVGLALLPDCQ